MKLLSIIDDETKEVLYAPDFLTDIGCAATAYSFLKSLDAESAEHRKLKIAISVYTNRTSDYQLYMPHSLNQCFKDWLIIESLRGREN